MLIIPTVVITDQATPRLAVAAPLDIAGIPPLALCTDGAIVAPLALTAPLLPRSLLSSPHSQDRARGINLVAHPAAERAAV